MVIAAAEVNPAMTGTEMKSIRNPSLSRISIKDARKVKQDAGMKSNKNLIPMVIDSQLIADDASLEGFF